MRLNEEVRVLETEYLLGGMIANAVDYDADVIVVVVRRGPDGKIVSADATKAGKHGGFGFLLESSEGQLVAAYADLDGDAAYQPGEPAWYFANDRGDPEPIAFLHEPRRGRVVGRLSDEVVVPTDLIEAARAYVGGRPLSEVLRGWSIPVQVGEIADLDDERFSSKRGTQGLWRPASFPIETGIGIYFLEPYDPRRIPVLFVYGAGGSPQNWRTIFEGLDRARFQPWFYLYPTGRRLDETATWLNNGVSYLREFYQFDRMAVVAHSMGGLVSRDFINKNVADGANRYIQNFVSISTPWAGHEAAKSGVEKSPAVVPSWYDLATGSEFLGELFAHPSPHLPAHHLIFTFQGKSSMVLPQSNDGTVSLASQLRDAAQEGAVGIRGFDATHTGVLSDPTLIEELNRILRSAFPPR